MSFSMEIHQQFRSNGAEDPSTVGSRRHAAANNVLGILGSGRKLFLQLSQLTWRKLCYDLDKKETIIQRRALRSTVALCKCRHRRPSPSRETDRRGKRRRETGEVEWGGRFSITVKKNREGEKRSYANRKQGLK